MISFDVSDKRFSHRTVGVFVDEEHVLLHRLEKDDFWALPGGRVELLEHTQQALIREMQEEIGVEVQAQRLLFVVENFFELEGKKFHELGFYYLLSADKTLPIYRKDIEHRGTEMGQTLIYKWFPLRDLPGVRLFPTFLREKLQRLPEHTEHIVHWDDEE